MIKVSKTSNSLFKSVFIGMLVIFILTTLGLIAGLPDTLPAKWWSLPLYALDYPLRFLMPIVAFAIGYFATMDTNKWSRLFDGAVFLASYWWFQMLFFTINLYVSEPSVSYGSAFAQIVIPNVLPIVLLGLYVIYLRKKSVVETIGLRREFMIPTLTAAIATTILQLASITKALMLNNIVIDEANLSVNITSLAPILSVLIVTGGYFVLRRIKDPLTQWFFATIATTLYVFAAYALIYLFGLMPREMWLIIFGNVASILATLFLLYRIKVSMSDDIVNR